MQAAIIENQTAVYDFVRKGEMGKNEKRKVGKLYLGCANSSCLLKVMVLP